MGQLRTDRYRDLVLVSQNVRAGADVASVVGFHAVGRVERPGEASAACPGSATASIMVCGGLVASGMRRAGMDPRCACASTRIAAAETQKQRPAQRPQDTEQVAPRHDSWPDPRRTRQRRPVMIR